MNKFPLQLVLAAAALLALPAQAVVVTFDFVVPLDGSGKTSPVIGANNVSDVAGGRLIETFDRGIVNGVRTCGPTGPLGPSGTLGVEYSYAVGSSSSAAAPAGDGTCYAYGPGPGGALNVPVFIDYAPLLSSGIYQGKKLNYLGLYYGSIDTYNNIQFFSGDTPINISSINGEAFSGSVLTGGDLLAVSGGASGNQFGAGSNIYVNMFFDSAEEFTKFSFTTSGIAFEMDNVATGIEINRVPEPAPLALLGLGLAAMVAVRRKQTVQAG